MSQKSKLMFALGLFVAAGFIAMLTSGAFRESRNNRSSDQFAAGSGGDGSVESGASSPGQGVIRGGVMEVPDF